jgi:tRNA1Val (adenine37-N6)-methyltransferase
MSESFFQFKQFRVEQDRCAMKVSTDACIQAAWTPIPPYCRSILDVGAGTGLLSLMLAQRAPNVEILALENDAAAAQQAAENAGASPFAARVEVVHADASAWSCGERFDLIICNPPFFKNSLQGPDARRNQARHMSSLDAACLIRLTLAQLAPEGLASFLWPEEVHEAFAEEAQQAGVFLLKELRICHRAGSRVGRVAGIFGRNKPLDVALKTLFIKDSSDGYTEDFRDLLRDFYLAL